MSFGPPPSVYTQSAVTAETQRKRRRRTWLLGVLVVVLVTAAATSSWLLRGGDGGTKPDDKAQDAAQSRLDVRETVEKPPASTTGTMAFRYSTDGMSPGEDHAMPGMWATDKILAKGIKQTLAGYAIGTDPAPGKNEESWKLRLGGPICGYTQRVTVENRTAVLYKASDREEAVCNHMVFFDLDDGKQVWDHTFPVSMAGLSVSAPQRTPSITLTHSTVVVTWGGGTDAYAMDGGKLRWRTKVTGPCKDDGAAGGRGLLIRQVCWTEDGQTTDPAEGTTYKVRKVDPATGEARWTYTAARGVFVLGIPSAEPPVVAVSAGGVDVTELLSLDAEGKNRATIRLQNGTYEGDCSYGDDFLVVDDCPTIAVGENQVFLRSKDQLEKQTSNWIVGFDLATGNTTRKFDSGPNALLRPVRVSGGELLALRASEDRITPMALVSLDPRTGKETPYLYFDLPYEAVALTLIDSNDVIVQNGRLFLGAKRAVGPTEQPKQWIYLVLGIGSSTANKP